MAKIGNWGSYIRFETSNRKVLTFDGFKRELSVRTSKHSLVNGGEILRQAIITKMSESYDIVMRRGEVAKMTINVTMSEYN